MKTRVRQRGYLLVTVALTLFLLATVAVVLSERSSSGASAASDEMDATRADYVTHAGMQHALWRAANNACMGDVSISNATFGIDNYTASISGATAGTAYTLQIDQDAWIRSDDVTKNNGTNTDQHIQFESGDIEHALFRFDLSALPANAQISAATAWFYVTPAGPGGGAHPEGTIAVHAVTSDWTETGATWENMNGNFDSTVLATIPAQPDDAVWVKINLTAQVQAWVNGQPNFGLLLASTHEGVHAKYASREGAANERPYIDVVTGSGPASPVSIQATGTLANGVTRSVNNPATFAYQPSVAYAFTPDGAESNDAEIWDQAPNNNYGDAAETWVSSASNDTTRTLLSFDLGRIPAGARVLDATLTLRRQSGSGADQPVSAHRILSPWSEDSVTWNNRETGTNWDTAGADFESAPVATTPVGPANQHYDWNITPLVQGWVDGSYPNYGVVLAAGMAGMPGERFYTSDQVQFDRRPSLTVTYACECGSPCMAPQGTGNVLMVIGNSPANPDGSEQAIREYLQSWGYTVSFIQDDDSQGNFDLGASNNDVVFVSETARASNIGTKLTNANIGVVTAEPNLVDELGIATSSSTPVSSSIDLVDNGHYISSVFSTGSIPIKTQNTSLAGVSGTLAPDAQLLANVSGVGGLLALDVGATTTTGGTTVGRRVMLPVGEGHTGWRYLTNAGQLLVQRSLAWAANLDAVEIGTVLMVVGNDNNLTTQESTKKTLIESWGFTVNLIDEDDSQALFDAALAANDVAFISEDVNASDVGTKLNAATIGVVTEEVNLSDELGFGGDIEWESGTTLKIYNTHYITSPLPEGTVTLLSTSESLATVTESIAPDIDILGKYDGEMALAALDAGAAISGGDSASGRRVLLPWGGSNMDVNHLNADGLTIFRRALEWGIGTGEEPYYLDTFPDFACDGADEYVGSDGSLDWSGYAWTESGDDGRACGADFRVMDDPVIADPNGNRLRLKNKNRSISRMVDLSSFSTAYLSFDYRRAGMSGSANVRIEVSGDGGSNWTTLQTIPEGDDGVYLSTSFDISPLIAADTVIRFSTDGDFNNAAYVDNVRVGPTGAGETGLVAHWKLDETSGTYAEDSVGGNHGTVFNGATWVPGKLAGGLSLDGVNDYIDVSSLNPRSYDDITISAWYKSAQSSVSDDEYIFEHTDNWVDEVTFGPTDDGGETLRFGLAVGGAWAPHYGTSDVVDEQWHHLVAVRANGRVRLYVDNVKETDEIDNFAGVTVTIDGQGPFIGDYPGQSEQVHGILDDVRLYDRALSESEISDLFDAGGGTGGPGGGAASYVEMNQDWLATNDNTWQTFDLGGFGVPANAVVEVAVINTKEKNERWGGVRATGSSLDRRFQLHEPESGGTDMLVLHVQADSSSRVQHYAEKKGEVTFEVLGYWTGASFTELASSFTAGSSNSWRTRNLSSYGVPPASVVELAIANTSTSSEYRAGARKSGSPHNRVLDIHEAESGGNDYVSLMVEAGSDAAASIEVMAESDSNIEFHVVGYWDIPPGSYTEAGGTNVSPSQSSAWHSVSLSSLGVPANAVAQVAISNANSSAERQLGIRETGSGLNRVLDLQEAESGGSDSATMHINIDGSVRFQMFAESSTSNVYLYPLGWWTLP